MYVNRKSLCLYMYASKKRTDAQKKVADAISIQQYDSFCMRLLYKRIIWQ